MPDFDTTVTALRRWAATHDVRARAAVELLCWHEHWLRRPDFSQACVHADPHSGTMWINWREAREFCDAGPRGSTGEVAILDLALTLGEDRFRFANMGHAHRRAIVRAVAVALGQEAPDG